MKHQVMTKLTNKEIGKILTNETLSISEMYMKVNKKKEINKQLWAFLHIGFIAALKLNGKTEKDCDEILEIAQKELA